MIGSLFDDDEDRLRQIDQPGTARDDGYKISIIMFMVQDAIAASNHLEDNGGKRERNYVYLGVRQADIKKAHVTTAEDDKQFMFAGDRRLPRMLEDLAKCKLVTKKVWPHTRWTKARTYYKLVDEKEAQKLLEDLKKLKLRKLLFCFKDLDASFRGNPGAMLIPKFGLGEVQ